MRNFLPVVFVALIAGSSSAFAAQQLGDTRMAPVINATCPAGTAYYHATNACVAQAPNGCCALNPPRATCAAAATPPGKQPWTGNPNDLKNQSVVCPR